MEYTDQKLLQFAYGMLVQAAEDQKADGRREWLQNNKTLEVISERVAKLALLEGRV